MKKILIVFVVLFFALSQIPFIVDFVTRKNEKSEKEETFDDTESSVLEETVSAIIVEPYEESEAPKDPLWYVYDFASEYCFGIYGTDADVRAVAEAEIWINFDTRIPFRRYLVAIDRYGITFNIIQTDDKWGLLLAKIRNEIADIKSQQSGIIGYTSWYWKDGIVLEGLDSTLSKFKRYIAVYYGL